MINNFYDLKRFYSDHGASRLYIKILSPNDNSKNQVYFGPGFEAINLFPMGEIEFDPSSANAIFKAPLEFFWLSDECDLVKAPSAQLILYPQYPEIRFSGFLRGSDRLKIKSVRELMMSRLPSRVLFLGVGDSSRIIGAVFNSAHSIAKEFLQSQNAFPEVTSIFRKITLPKFLGGEGDPKRILLGELSRINHLGWIDSRRLDANGDLIVCSAPQCGGYTLEAQFGIIPNGRSEPDYLGWEIKQYGQNVLTLMTPEPNGGAYVEKGVKEFVKRYGYPDRAGRVNRMNFGGIHYCERQHPTTKLTMKLVGYDFEKNKITDPNGGISLVSVAGEVAASWSFSGILSHWNRKHQNAVYVPSQHRTFPENQYSYGAEVLLCEGTDPLLFTKAIKDQKIYYDPGIKVENINAERPAVKRRSQFRIKLKDIDCLYKSVVKEDVNNLDE
jgi:hypothetical protein